MLREIREWLQEAFIIGFFGIMIGLALGVVLIFISTTGSVVDMPNPAVFNPATVVYSDI